MIVHYAYQKYKLQERISQKTLDTTFLRLIENGANCPPFVSRAILDTAKKVYHFNDSNQFNIIKPGQIIIVGIDAHEPAGRPLAQCQKKECLITLYNDAEDDRIRAQYGTSGLRRHKILRIASQAWEQDVLLTQEDLAYKILHCGLRTVARDIKFFKEHNVIVPTRGQQKDIGPGTSHKIMAVELMLKRKDELQIAQLLYHSLKAIERYTLSFARIAVLKDKGFSNDEIAFVVQHSKRLVEEYITLYQRYKNKPQYKERLNEILGKAQNFDDLGARFLNDKKKSKGALS